MAGSQELIGARFQQLAEGAEALRAHVSGSDFGDWINDAAGLARWRAQSRAALRALGASAETYANDFDAVEAKASTNDLGDFERQLGIVQAVLADLESGFLLRSARALIISELLADLSDQATVLLEGGYLAAATSIAGAELEQGLRALSEAKGVTVKAREDISSLATKLAQAGHLSALQQKQIATWKALRDAADHGDHQQLTQPDVVDLVNAVQRFLAEEL